MFIFIRGDVMFKSKLEVFNKILTSAAIFSLVMNPFTTSVALAKTAAESH